MTREEKLAGLAYRLDEIYADNPSAAQPVVESSQPALYTPQTMKASQTNRQPAAQTVQQSAAVAEFDPKTADISALDAEIARVQKLVVEKSNREAATVNMQGYSDNRSWEERYADEQNKDDSLERQLEQLKAQRELANRAQYEAAGEAALAKVSAEDINTLDMILAGPVEDTLVMQGDSDNRSWEERYAENEAYKEGLRQKLRQHGYDDSQIAKLLDYRQRQVNRQTYEAEIAKTKAYAENHEWGASLASVPQNLTGGLAALDFATQTLRKKMTGDDRPIDIYSGEYVGAGKAAAARETVSKDMSGAGAFVYNTVMSVADSATAMAIGGALGTLSAGGSAATSAATNAAMKKFVSRTTSTLMGSTAATQAILDAKERGVSDVNALLTGVAAGVAEGFFEEYSVGRLLDAKVVSGTLLERTKQALKNMGVQALVEGSEEGATTIANAMADSIINGSLSDLETRIRRYVESGYSEADAREAVRGEWVRGLVMDVLGGMLSGGIMSAGRTVADIGGRSDGGIAPASSDEALSGDEATTVTPQVENGTEGEISPHSDGAYTPTDPLAAIVSAAQEGRVTNRQVRTVALSPEDLQRLGIDTNGKTASQIRAEVRAALDARAAADRAPTNDGFLDAADVRTEEITSGDVENSNSFDGEMTAQYNESSEKNDNGGAQDEREEFRRLQEKSRAKHFVGHEERSDDSENYERLRERLPAVLSGEMERRGYHAGTNRVLHLTSAKGTSFDVVEVDAQTFRDMFEISRKYTQNGELVDIHPVKTTEDSVGYEECVNILALDGLCGFSVTPSGDLISVFNGSGKKGFLYAIAPEVRLRAKTLDCYISDKQDLMTMYSKVFGFKTASIMEHNPVYDHDGIAKNHGNPKVAFMVNSDKPVVTRHFGKEEYDAAQAYQQSYIADDSGTNDVQPEMKPNPESSVGAAERGFSPYSSLEFEYGVLPSGEHPVRSDDVPVSTNGTDRVSQSVVTMVGAEAIPDGRIDTIRQAVVDGKFSHIRLPNTVASSRARDSIRNKGFDRALQDFLVDVRSGKAGAVLTATGVHLLNNAANSNMSGADFIELATACAQMLRNSSQGTQAWRILKQLTPEARLYQINREIARYNDENMVESLRGEIASREGIKLDEDLVDRFLAAETEEQRDAILEEMKQDVGRQMKASGMDKFTALRYINMLGNFRTNVRNLGGNLGMRGLRVVQNGIATGLERLAGTERTRSLVVSKEYMDVGRRDFEANKREAMGEAKYTARSEAQGFMRDAREHMRVFTSRGLGTGLEAYRKGTQWLMNNKFFGDEAFARHAYARALAGYLKAQGITAEQFGSEEWQNEHTEAVDKARAFAVKEAQEATFRDNTALAEAMVKLRIYGNSPVSKALNVMVDGLMPFRKTPANVFVRAMEYSPVSIGKTVLDAARKAASNTALADREGALGNFVRSGGDISGADIVNELAKGLTGTGLVALGMLLRAGGYLRGKDDDEKRATLDELDGHQDYSLEMPDGTSLTVDWLTPASMPLFMGAELMDIVSANGVEAKGVADALMGIADPMLEMSMMQGIDDALKDIRYTEGNSVLQMAANLALDYMFQGVTNTLFGQLERTVTGESTTNYVDKDSAIPAWLQKEIGAASRKAPGDYNQIPYIDEWGQVEETGDVMTRAVNNLFNPGYVSRIENDAVNKELRRLYEKTGEGGVVPSRAEKSFTAGGEQRNLTAEEYVKYATTLGQTRYRYMQEAINSSYYKSLSDNGKAEYIGKLYGYANYKAKREVEPRYDNDTYRKVATAEAAGISPTKYFELRSSVDVDGNGYVSQEEAELCLNGQRSMSDDQKDAFWRLIDSSWKYRPYA